jgi:nucleoside 2-deoxyribosyltransferase
MGKNMVSLSDKSCRVYCAGPLFNASERAEMTEIADTLVEAGYDVYLPHRDGMEFRLVLEVLVQRNWPPAVAAHFLHAAIFALDVYQAAIVCDAMVWNLNGRTPDEGAVSEAAMAWTLGKPLVAYKDDVRSLIAGRVNPLLVGLVDFDTVDNITHIPGALGDALRSQPVSRIKLDNLPAKLRKTISDGRRLWDTMGNTAIQVGNERVADVVTELFAPSENPLYS